MKYSINTWVYKDTPAEEAIERLNKLGYSGVELPGFPDQFSQQRRGELRRMLRRLEMEAVTICAGLAMRPPDFNLNTKNNEVQQKTVRYVNSCTDLAASVGSKLVIIATGPIDTGASKEDALKLAYRSIRECCDYAEKSGVTVVLEHFKGRLIETTDETLGTVGAIRRRNFRVLLDTGHLNLTKENLANSAKKAAKHLAHIHIDNNDGLSDSHRPLTEGTLRREDFVAFTKALKQAGYEGYHSFEIINVPDPNAVAKGSKEFWESVLGQA